MLKPIILELKTYLNWDPKTEIDYMIRGDFPRYYNKENWEENINKKVRYLIIYNQLIMKTQLAVNKDIKIFININKLTKLTKEWLIKKL